MILIAVPSFDMLHADFALSLVNLTVLSCSQGLKIRIISPRSSIISQSREIAVKEFMGSDEYTHLLFLDSDMIHPADTLLRLLQAEKLVVGATYARRQPSDGDPVTMVPPAFWANIGNDTPIEVIELPAGCLLIHKQALNRLGEAQLAPPVFEIHVEPDMRVVGEDQVLCRKLHDAGVDIFALPKLSSEITHLGMVGFQLRKPNAGISEVPPP